MSKPETVGRNKIASMQYSLSNKDGVVVREASEEEIRQQQVIAQE